LFIGGGAWRLGGTPADCVKAALGHLLPERPDFVFSGINRGWNAGYDVAYSGTVAAALEAAMQGVLAIAFSTEYPENYETAEALLPSLALELMGKDPGRCAIWNVNFPGCALSELRGVKYDCSVAPLQLYADGFLTEPDGEGGRRLWQRGTRTDASLVPEGTDLAALLAGFVSVGRLRSVVTG
jgi:5'-nucleotidase